MRQQHVNEEVSADYKPKVNMKTSGDRINRKKRMVIPIRCVVDAPSVNRRTISQNDAEKEKHNSKNISQKKASRIFYT